MRSVSLICLMTLCLCSLSLSTYAQESPTASTNPSIQGFGMQSFGAQTIDSLQSSGMLTLQGTRIRGALLVNGTLVAEGIEASSLQVNGRASLTKGVIRGPTTINGFLSCQGTEFQGALSIATESLVLNACIVDSILIRSNTGWRGLQTLELREGTKVNGPITFESGRGVLITSQGCVITGPITGVYQK